MNFYKHHIGDYAAATPHLSFIEDAAYTRLIRIYYRDERPLPVDSKAVQRLAGARTKEEREAVETVLVEFFVLADDGWHSKRCDEEIGKANAQALTNKRIAEEREARRAARTVARDDNESLNESSNEPESVRQPSQTPDTRLHKQQELIPAIAGIVPGKPVTPKPQIPDCPHADIVAAYHELLPELARVRDWTPDRQAFLRSRWREKPERQSVAWWRGYFDYVRTCPFLMGQGATSPDRDPFLADLEWLVRPKNFRKVIEGKYQRRAA